MLTGLRDRFTGFYETLKSNSDVSLPRVRGSRAGVPWCLRSSTPTCSNFLFYFVVVPPFVSMTEVYNFFELLPDYIHNHITLVKMFTYLFFLTPELIYRLAPISVLVAVLINFGVLTKHNEVTAFRACGVSLFRLALPILVMSTLFTGGLFAFDFYWVPDANRKQDALRDEIKNRPKQTYLRPDRNGLWRPRNRASTTTSISTATHDWPERLRTRSFQLRTLSPDPGRAGKLERIRPYVDPRNGWVPIFRPDIPNPMRNSRSSHFPISPKLPPISSPRRSRKSR